MSEQPTREQIMSAMIGHIYEDPEPVVRQGMPEQEWTLLSLAADAVVGLLNGTLILTESGVEWKVS